MFFQPVWSCWWEEGEENAVFSVSSKTHRGYFLQPFPGGSCAYSLRSTREAAVSFLGCGLGAFLAN